MNIAVKPTSKKTKLWSKNSRTMPISIPALATIFLALGYYLGNYRKLIDYANDPLFSSPLSSFDGIMSPQVMLSTFRNQVTNRNTNTTRNDTKQANIFQLHKSIKLSEDPKLYRKLVYPQVQKLLESGDIDDCPLDQVKPYLDILKNIDGDPLYYEDSTNNNKNEQTCPVVFLFYFEGGSEMADFFFDFYSNIKTKRCLNFAVSNHWIDEPGTKEMAEDHGYTIIRKHGATQDKTISQSVYDIKENHGDNVLLSVNDMDHLLTWFDSSGQPHRYSSYTDMVRLYAYELLSTEGCSDQNVMEKYVIPCTCLMENNERYVATNKDEVFWSEYGVTNRFHPTGNFYLDRSLPIAQDSQSYRSYDIGTVFANLRKFDGDIIAHHKIGWKTKKVYSRARMTGVIHARVDSTLQSLTKYQHFLTNSMQRNDQRNENATVAVAMGCSVVDTLRMLKGQKTCKSVKELANILSIGHQKLACLNAGYSEEHCMSDMGCCLTY